MHHDHVLKKLNFDLLTPSPGFGVARGVCWQNICYHVSTIRDSNKFEMQHNHVLEKLTFDLLTPSPGFGVGWG